MMHGLRNIKLCIKLFYFVKTPRFDVRSALALSTEHFVYFLHPLGRISEVLV